MELEFTWIDALMIIIVFVTIGLITGKNEYDKKLKKVQLNTDEIEENRYQELEKRVKVLEDTQKKSSHE